MEIRVIGTERELHLMVTQLSLAFDISFMSDWYPARGKDRATGEQRYRQYLIVKGEE